MHVLTPDTVNRELPLLRKFHQFRHKVFVETLKRTDLHTTHKFEYDIWDTPLFQPVRFLLTWDGEAIGAARMVSSEHLTMFEAKYDEFLFKPHDKRADLWEIQRLGVRLDMSPRETERAILELMIGIHEWSKLNGIKDVMLMTFTGIAEKRLEDMTPIGRPKMHMGAEYIALQCELDPVILQTQRERRDALIPRIHCNVAA
ncbi:MAG: hypothetical protein L3J02_06880 [Henriciella sp.]|nr:hypothetical protein [Henriciella sp.]